jgi:hypothetical protein
VSFNSIPFEFLTCFREEAAPNPNIAKKEKKLAHAIFVANKYMNKNFIKKL